MTFIIGPAMLEMCVLAKLSEKDMYGYILTQNIKEIITVSATTLYPVLRRLQKDGCVTTYDEPYSGRNRRYYKITEPGKERLREYKIEWSNYKIGVDKMLFGCGLDEQTRVYVAIEKIAKKSTV